MATDAEIIQFARRVASGAAHPDVPPNAAIWDSFTEEERSRVLAYAVYEMRRKTSKAQRRAQRLLRTWLTIQQRAELKWTGYFWATGSAGGRYRFHPRLAFTERMEKHGTRWFYASRFCLHDDAGELPEADLTLAHLLMILTDEPGFLAAANEHKRDFMLWNGAWKRRLNQARREREAQAKTEAA